MCDLADPLQLRCDVTYDFALHSSLSVVWVLSNKAGSRQVAPLLPAQPALLCVQVGGDGAGRVRARADRVVSVL